MFWYISVVGIVSIVYFRIVFMIKTYLGLKILLFIWIKIHLQIDFDCATIGRNVNLEPINQRNSIPFDWLRINFIHRIYLRLPFVGCLLKGFLFLWKKDFGLQSHRSFWGVHRTKATAKKKEKPDIDDEITVYYGTPFESGTNRKIPLIHWLHYWLPV